MRSLAIPLLLVAAACSNKLGGEVEVNGEKQTLSSCRNGVVYGFRGVEVSMRSGMRLRIAMTQTGEARLVYMPAGSETGTDVGLCGVLSISDQNSTINSVRNVEGKVTLDCATDGFTVKGELSFENCH
jgi:hypothetical protein